VIWNAERACGEALHYGKVCKVDEDICDPNDGQNTWWQYHWPPVLPRFYLVVLLSTLLIRHGIEMRKEGGTER
jgi:hypothetical protein